MLRPRSFRASADSYFCRQLISPEGIVIQAYRKIHLFDVNIKGGAVILESNTTVPGKALLPPAETPLGKSELRSLSTLTALLPLPTLVVGLLTCYDLRFPEVSLSLRRQGAQILTYPSAFTLRTGAAHWGSSISIFSLCYHLTHSLVSPSQQKPSSEPAPSKPKLTSSPPLKSALTRPHDNPTATLSSSTLGALYLLKGLIGSPSSSRRGKMDRRMRLPSLPPRWIWSGCRARGRACRFGSRGGMMCTLFCRLVDVS